MSMENKFADDLSSVLSQIEDLKIEAKAIIDAAHDAGVNTKALRKVAKEMLMDSAKLAKRLEDEAQLDIFRYKIGLRRSKGLDGFAELAARVFEAAE